MRGVLHTCRARRYRDPPWPTDHMKRLVIVESPAKAKTIAGYLGADYVVESSVGHIRDLPERAAEIPEESRARRGRGSASTSTTTSSRSTSSTRDKKKVVAELKEARRTPTSSSSRPTRTARARRSPGTCSRC